MLVRYGDSPPFLKDSLAFVFRADDKGNVVTVAAGLPFCPVFLGATLVTLIRNLIISGFLVVVGAGGSSWRRVRLC